MYPGQCITPEMLPPEMLSATRVASVNSLKDITHGNDHGFGIGPFEPENEAWPADFKAARALFEAKFLEEKLNGCNGSITKLSEIIGMERSYLYKKLRSFGLLTTE